MASKSRKGPKRPKMGPKRAFLGPFWAFWDFLAIFACNYRQKWPQSAQKPKMAQNGRFSAAKPKKRAKKALFWSQGRYPTGTLTPAKHAKSWSIRERLRGPLAEAGLWTPENTVFWPFRAGKPALKVARKYEF